MVKFWTTPIKSTKRGNQRRINERPRRGALDELIRKAGGQDTRDTGLNIFEFLIFVRLRDDFG